MTINVSPLTRRSLPFDRGFDAFGRRIPPPPPEGFDGWGNWVDTTKPDPRLVGMMPGFPGFPGAAGVGRPPFQPGMGVPAWTEVPQADPPPPEVKTVTVAADSDRPEP
jgi:hypothetical protein